ncbi:MAG: triple tyrosine motif-containing protein [Bacteroidales bacterium]
MPAIREHYWISGVVKIRLCFVCFIFISLPLFSQNPFNITNYKKSDYHAANQNWDIDLDEAGNVYLANSKGLLKLSGSKFELYELPAKTIVRSVAIIDSLVYTGSFEEFGFWAPDNKGSLCYHSLATYLTDDTLENDEIWKIVNHRDKIYFQSFGKLLCYDHQRVISIPIPGSILFLLKCNERLFAQEIGGGLYEIVENELFFINGSQIFSDTEVKTILPFKSGKFIIGTSSKGLYLFDGLSFTYWQNEASELLMDLKINNGVKSGNLFIFGTIIKGLIILDETGRLVNHIHTGNSLQNNTVLALCLDNDNNLWVGLDKGFDYIAFDSPLIYYNYDVTGFGAVYTACLYKDTLFVGTNHGIYYFASDKIGFYSNKSFLAGSQGQVWFIKNIDGKLYTGLNDGTYLIENLKLRPVSSVNGGFNLEKTSFNNADHLIQGTYNELVIYNNVKGIWQQHHTIKGFGAPARFLEVDHTGNIWLGHIVSGIYMVQPDMNYQEVVKIVNPLENTEFDKNHNRVYKIDNRIIVPTGRTMLQWDAVKNKLVPYDELVKQLEGFESSLTIIPALPNQYWFVNNNELGLFEIRFEKARLINRIIPEMYGLNLVEDYENIITLNDSIYLVCLENGISLLNLNKLNRMKGLDNAPVINEAVFWKNADNQLHINIGSDRNKEIRHTHNNLKFAFSASGSAGKKKYFQYKLNGLETNWSQWTVNTEVTYNRLPPGLYTFLLRTLDPQGKITEGTGVVIKIKPPWYLSYFAIAFYLIMLVGLIWLIRLNYLRRYWKNMEVALKKEQELLLQEKERAEKEVIRLTNENLQAEIAMKNAQLANNTMILIRKNELLSEIRDELDRQREELGSRIPKKYYQKISRLIDDSIKSDHDWEMFEKLFDQAHKNFFQKLKSDYPDLTSGDLRLCAYLRLNLSSKEIAPLLNITVRGVEERRYRLRKRLQLPSDVNISEFILSY